MNIQHIYDAPLALESNMIKIDPDFGTKFLDDGNILVSVVDCAQVR